MADSSPRIACRGSASPWCGSGQLWNGLVGSGVDWIVGHAADPAAQVGVGACLGDYLAGWVDLAGVVSVQLDHRGHLVWLGRLADSGLSPQKGLLSAVLGAVVYSVISAVVLRALGIADVDFTRAGLIGSLA